MASTTDRVAVTCTCHVAAGRKVKGVLLSAVLEGVEVVSRHGLDAVIQKTPRGALPSAGKARLEGPCARILTADVVSVVCPDHPESLVHLQGSEEKVIFINLK